MRLGIGLGITTQSIGEVIAQIITGTAPVLGIAYDGDTVADVVTFANDYTSSASGSTFIDSQEMNINSGGWVAYVGTTALVEGDTVQVRETVSDGAATPPRPFTSNQVTVLAALTAPTVSTAATFTGTPQVDVLLTGTPATFAGNPAPTVVNEFLMDGLVVATGTTYTPVTGDIDAIPTFRSTATNSQGSIASTSAGGAAVLPALEAPAVATAATFAGTPQVGVLLTGTPATFTGYPVPTVVNTWLMDGVTVATADTYTPVTGDIGAFPIFRSTATNTEGSAVSNSAAGAAVAGDVTAPVFSSATYVDPDLTVNLDEASNIYYFVNGDATVLAGSVIKSTALAATEDVYGGPIAAATGEAVVISPDWSPLTSGTYYLHVTAEDAAGNFAIDEVTEVIYTAPSATFTTSATGPAFYDSLNNTGLGNQYTFAYQGSITDRGATQTIFSTDVAAVNISIGTTGLVVATIKGVVGGNNFTTVIASASSSPTAITFGTSSLFVGCIDWVAGTFKFWQDGTLIANMTMSSSGITGSPNTNIMMLCQQGATNVNFTAGTFESLRVWLNEVVTTGVEPVAAPYHEVTGPAATANADAWKVGSDAT